MQQSKSRLHAIGRHGTPLALTLLTLWLLRHNLPSIDFAAALAVFEGFGPAKWGLAAVFTIISLASVGFYDVTAARVMQLPVSRAAAFSAGWRATAIAQALGFGVITGALVRWRLLGLKGQDGLWTATKMTGLVTASYFYGWFIVAGLAATLSPGLPDQIWWLGVLALWIGCSAAAFALRASPYGLKAYPPVILLAGVSGLTFIDTLAASLVIYCFLPDGYAPFAMFYVSFLIAYSVGMISGVPGGVGPFEMCLLALLAPTDPTPLLAALLAYRAVYFLAPAAIAGISLVVPHRHARGVAPPTKPTARPELPAEAALIGQGALNPVVGQTAGGLACETLNCEIYLRDPVGSDIATFLWDRKAACRTKGQRLVLYKCSAAVLAMARSAGLSAVPIASEAVLDPASFNTTGPELAQLRRKLRKADKAGVCFCDGPARQNEMHDIDRKWQARCGRARGFSVGQYCPDLLRIQAVFTAYQNDKPIAYVSFHISEKRWVLDLMRSVDGCPDGTMHGLVIQALCSARSRGISEVSLCSVPFFAPQLTTGFSAWVLEQAYKASASAQGLKRFKSSFAPEWRPEYYAYDGLLGLALGAHDLSQLITAPIAVPKPAATIEIHHHYDYYEFASISKQ